VNKRELLLEGINSAAKSYAKLLGKSVQDIKNTKEWLGLVDIDPTPKKKYLDWIVADLIPYVQGTTDAERDRFGTAEWEDLWYEPLEVFNAKAVLKILESKERYSEILKRFWQFTENKIITGKEAEINSYKNFIEIEAAIKKAEKHKQTRFIRKYSKKDIEIRDDAELILSTDSYYVVRPLSTEASVFYGKGIPWCIAGPENPHFWRYKAQDLNIYMIIITNPDVLKELEEIYAPVENGYNLTKKVSKLAILVDSMGRVSSHWNGENEPFNSGYGAYLRHLRIDSAIFKSQTQKEHRQAQQEFRKLTATSDLRQRMEGRIIDTLSWFRNMSKDMYFSAWANEGFVKRAASIKPELFEIKIEIGSGGYVEVSSEFMLLSSPEQGLIMMEILYLLDELKPKFAEEWEEKNPDKIAKTLSEQLIRRAYRIKP
jgi:hypothetical protein